MQGGLGDDSYAKNSELQNYNFHAYAKDDLATAIGLCHLFDPPSSKTVRIADFGCSSGRNAVEHAEFVVEQILLKRGTATDIQYFFSDVPSNDFNLLFQLLKPSNMGSNNFKLEKFYAAGVPGSFYMRLFPEGCLDFAISLHALHWLSRVPPAVLDKTSAAWNGGHVWIHEDRPKVSEAYAQQFQSDIKMFLNHRVAEMAKGAILFFITSSRAEEHPKGNNHDRFAHMWSDPFESAWNEMVSEGIVSAEERDMFNVPQYNFHRAELEEALKDIPELEVIKMEAKGGDMLLPDMLVQQLVSNPQKFADVWSVALMAVLKPMLQKHIGENRAAEFSKFLHKAVAMKASSVKTVQIDMLVVILRRR